MGKLAAGCATVLFLLVASGCALIDPDAGTNYLPMENAAGSCDLARVKVLVDGGHSSVGFVDNGWTPLGWALYGARIDHSEGSDTDNRCRETVIWLLSEGADPGLVSNEGGGAPYIVLSGLNPPGILDLLGDSRLDTWCDVPVERGWDSRTLVEMAGEHPRWTRQDAAKYLRECQ